MHCVCVLACTGCNSLAHPASHSISLSLSSPHYTYEHNSAYRELGDEGGKRKRMENDPTEIFSANLCTREECRNLAAAGQKNPGQD